MGTLFSLIYIFSHHDTETFVCLRHLWWWDILKITVLNTWTCLDMLKAERESMCGCLGVCLYQWSETFCSQGQVAVLCRCGGLECAYSCCWEFFIILRILFYGWNKWPGILSKALHDGCECIRPVVIQAGHRCFFGTGLMVVILKHTGFQ